MIELGGKRMLLFNLISSLELVRSPTENTYTLFYFVYFLLDLKSKKNEENIIHGWMTIASHVNKPNNNNNKPFNLTRLKGYNIWTSVLHILCNI